LPIDRTGLVTRAEGALLWVVLDGREVPCVLRGRLKKKQLRVTSLVVVGDEVEVSLLPDGQGVIEDVKPRRTELVRPGFHGYAHVTAANLDLLAVVQSARQPAFQRTLVERFLVTAARGGMKAIVVVNKCDLEEESLIRSWVEPLAGNGVEVLLTSATTGRGVEELRGRLRGLLSCLAGKSGVGKSSLLNAMFPGLDLRTRPIAEGKDKGRHVTTSSRLYPLPGGGYLADTPGVKSLGLFEDTGDDVRGVFPEIVAAAGGCKFRDCGHTHEPDCAVKAAVKDGAIDEARYKSYVRLQRRNGP
jgi:ribosome biogenesis GTPase